MTDIENLIVRMKLVIGEAVSDPVVQARTEVLALLLTEHIAEHDPDEQRRIHTLLEGLVQAMEELGPTAFLDELFARANEIAATRH